MHTRKADIAPKMIVLARGHSAKNDCCILSMVAAVPGAGDSGSHPRRQPILPERGESAKMHAKSGVIWGIPDNANTNTPARAY
jgi:hypothetical protein